MRKLLAAAVLLIALPALAQELPTRQHAVTIDNLTNVPRLLLPTLPARSIHHCVIIGGAADETVLARAVDDSPVYATIPIAAGETKVIAIGSPVTEEGLEIGTTNPAGDVSVSCVFVFVTN